jgi:hypothetical protein
VQLVAVCWKRDNRLRPARQSTTDPSRRLKSASHFWEQTTTPCCWVFRCGPPQLRLDVDAARLRLGGWRGGAISARVAAWRRRRRVVEDARNPRLRRHVSHLPARLPLYRRSCRHGAADSPSRPTSALQRALTDTRNPPSGRRVSRLSVRCCGCEVGSVSPFSREGGKP